MNTPHSIVYKYFLLVLFFALSQVDGVAQKLLESQQGSSYTYLYKISNIQAENIYENEYLYLDDSFFEVLIDSFLVTEHYKKELPIGHYLKAYSNKNRVRISITSIHNFNVEILNNQTDLCVQVFDTLGQAVQNAKVWAKNKKLRYDKKTKSFIHRKSNKKGVLKIEYNGEIAYYNLNRGHWNPLIKRSYYQVMYGKPIGYVWRPVSDILLLPVDGVRSLVKWRPVGRISGIRWRFRNSFRKIANIFNKYDRINKPTGGYVAFNKAKYLPQDTVKVKTFIVDKKGKPINKDLEVVLDRRSGKKDIVLTTLSPYRKGAYTYEFALHDSLELTLDKDYSLYFRDEKRTVYKRTSFRYEDYELSKTILSLRTPTKKHYNGESLKIYVQGKDENELNILDGRVEVVAKIKNFSQYFGNYVFVPDTLYFEQKKLNPIGETLIEIPDSLYPTGNFKYEFEVKLLTSDNEVKTRKETIEYFEKKQEISITLERDSVLCSFKEDGIDTEINATVYGVDGFGYKTEIAQTTLPYRCEINPYFQQYLVETMVESKSLFVKQETGLIACVTNRTKDSLQVKIQNPRKLFFSYFLYKGNREIERGYTDSLTIQKKISNKQPYYVAVQYLWGGKVKSVTYSVVSPKEKTLNIAVNQPELVYPGQKATIEVAVTDVEGKPVSGVDLTAYAMTKKFNYRIPNLPNYEKKTKSKKFINSFTNEATEATIIRNFSYDEWIKIAGLDSIEYYNFLFPKDSIYKFSYEIKDSITQFAPFVMRNGQAQEIHVIYVDDRPVYFGWTDIQTPYSFKINPGLHTIKIRMQDRLITLKNMNFVLNKKTIFSFNDDLTNDNVSFKLMPTSLSQNEKKRLYPYIFQYQQNFWSSKKIYLKQDDFIQILSKQKGMAGPIAPYTATIHYLDKLVADEVKQFRPEANFKYSLEGDVIKMYPIDHTKESFKFLNNFNAETSLSDECLIEQKIIDDWHKRPKTKVDLIYPKYPYISHARLKIDLKTHKQDSCKYTFLFKEEEESFMRIYRPNQQNFIGLSKGSYKVVYLYEDETYATIDSLFIQDNGTNYYRIQDSLVYKEDGFEKQLEKLAKNLLYTIEVGENEIKQTRKNLEQYSGEGRIVRGRVVDQNGEPLIGVNIIVDNSRIGTITNLGGDYELNVPLQAQLLIFNYIGYDEQVVDIQGITSDFINTDIVMEEDLVSLEEVIVVGYRMIENMQASAVTVTALGISSLSSKAAGVDVVSANISVRGSSTVATQNPLYIVDGQIFLGDLSEINEEGILTIESVTDEEQLKVYGAKGKNGVVLITTKDGEAKKEAMSDEAFWASASEGNSMRDDFSDYAFWQPTLQTNKEGKAFFEAKFPDDVTNWQTMYLAMNDKKQTGRQQAFVKSYRPLMGQVSLPRFLLENDSSFVIGKALNYTTDTLNINRKFSINDKEIFNKDGSCIHALLDTFLVSTTTAEDSLTLAYSIKKEDGYFDGEKRVLPVFPIGLEETKGSFYVLNNDTTIELSFDEDLGMVQIYAQNSMLHLLEIEIERVIAYRYLCNEQLASKLKMLLAAETIQKAKSEKFKHSDKVKKIIRLIAKRRKSNNLWSWWENDNINYWISGHVNEALLLAQKMGYKTDLKSQETISFLRTGLSLQQSFSDKLSILKMLSVLEEDTVMMKQYMKNIAPEKPEKIRLGLQLQYWELCQKYDIPVDITELQKYEQTTIFGNIYYAVKREGEPTRNVYKNAVQTTLSAYRILRNQPNIPKETLAKTRNYFLEKRSNGYWRNTYETATIIETILPDLLKDTIEEGQLVISGANSKKITAFPYEGTCDETEKITITKTGSLPIYFTAYQQEWNQNPETKKGDFEIKTYFEGNTTNLKAGEKINLIAKVKIKKDAEYVMLNVPIPAACSYGKKPNYHRRPEVHREYFKNEVAIFCEKLPIGEYEFSIELMPRYTGKYTLNPAKIELMYFPTFSANNEITKVQVD